MPIITTFQLMPYIVFLLQASFLESRASTLNKIIDALRDENINLIGVWGMGGVGKTTLLKQVAQQAKQHHLFNRQAYIDLSSIPDSENLRQRIAKALGFTLRRKDESRRADELKQKLKQRLKEGKILIILDDIWTEVDLEQVGIPSKDDIWGVSLQWTRMISEAKTSQQTINITHIL